MRKVLLGVGVLVAIIAGGAWWLWSNLDGLVKTAIERTGTKVAGVAVSVSAVHLDLTHGKASIEGLKVANPKGFNTPTAISIGAVAVALDPAAAGKKPLVITSVSIAAPQVTYEVGTQGSNIDAIKKNVDNFVGAGEAAKTETPTAPKPADDAQSSGKGESLIISKLTVTDGQVTLSSPLPGGKVSAPLPAITLTDIGKAKGGASPADVAEQVLVAISHGAVKAASSLSLGAITDTTKGAVGGVGDTLKGFMGK